jgi:hypothetical protein
MSTTDRATAITGSTPNMRLKSSRELQEIITSKSPLELRRATETEIARRRCVRQWHNDEAKIGLE